MKQLTPEQAAAILINPVPPSKEIGGCAEEAGNDQAPLAADLRGKFARLYYENFPKSYTADEVAAYFMVSPFSARPRVSELHKAGLIKKSSERRRNRSNQMAAAWIGTALLVGEEAVAIAEGRPYQRSLETSSLIVPSVGGAA